MSIGHIIARGFAAAHAALVGALFVFLLQAPVQVLSAVGQGLQGEAMRGAGQQPDMNLVMLSLGFSCGTFVLALAVFFLFPLVQGGILGQVRVRLESPGQRPGPFGVYGRAFYRRLLGSQALFTLVILVVMVPVMCLSVVVTLQEIARAMPAGAAEGAPAPATLDPHEFTRQLLSNPAVLAGMVIASLLVSAVGIVYWVADCIVVSERERVVVSWRKALHFCRQNFSAVLVVWLLNLAVGLVISPLGLVVQLGLVARVVPVVALALVVALTLLYAALISYWSVLLAGLTMSLYLARRSPAEQPEPAVSAPA